MSTEDVFSRSTLAEASYADLWDADNNKTIMAPSEVQEALQRIGNDDGEPDDPDKGFSPSQATEFTDRWRVIDHQPNTDSGYSGTLFERLDANLNPTGHYVLAFRGTEGLFSNDLWETDIGDIVIDGLALDQIVDMYNHWQRMTHSGVYRAACLDTLGVETAAYQAARLGRIVGLATGQYMGADGYLDYLRARKDVVIDEPLGLVRRVRFEDSQILFTDQRAVGLGLGPSIVGRTDATGHSLGGHLASAFTRLVAGTGVEAVTINGAGYPTGHVPGLGGSAETNIGNLFSMLTGATVFDARRNANVYGEAMPEVITMDEKWGLKQPGSHVPVFIEQPGLLGNTLGHDISQMTDTLAVHDLFIQLSAGLRQSKVGGVLPSLTPVFEAVTNRPGETLERLVSALGNLFESGGARAQTGNRESLYQSIVAVRDAGPYQQSVVGGSAVLVDLSAVGDPEVLAALARQSLATRYALVHLEPFAFDDIDAVYQQHNPHGELDLHDRATGAGKLTEAYLHDRADFLTRIVERNRADSHFVPETNGRELFWDYSSGERLYALEGHPVFRPNGDPDVDESTFRHFLFGGDAGEALGGSDLDDGLFGGDGGDVLRGGLGADYIEGNDGADVLLGGDSTGDDGAVDTLVGGPGSDVYFAGIGDIIEDWDGQGLVFFDGEPLAGGWLDPRGAGTHLSRDERFTYGLAADGTLSIGRLHHGAVQPGVLTILDFTRGDLGIDLVDNPLHLPAVLSGTAGADTLDVPSPASPGPYGRVEGLGGGDTITLGTAHGSAVAIYGGNGDDTVRLDADRLDDRLMAGRGGTVFGGAGGDLLEGSRRSDLIQGGGGHDQGFGGAGEDVIAGGTENDWVSGGTEDDILQGDDGEDYILGGAGDDYLAGGNDADVLYGDAEGQYPHWQGALGEVNLPEPVLPGDYGVLTEAAEGGLDVLFGGAGGDELYGGGGSDELYGEADNDVIEGEGGDDSLHGGGGDDYLYGDKQLAHYLADNLVFDSGHLDGANGLPAGDWRYQWRRHADAADVAGDDDLSGGAGDDHLFGGGGDDTLEGGGDDDSLFGGAGNDTYVYRPDDGADVIADAGGGADRLLMQEGITAAEVSLSMNGADLMLHIDDAETGTLGSVTITGWGVAGHRIESIAFEGGPVQTAAQVDAGIDTYYLNAGDVVAGNAADNRYVVRNDLADGFAIRIHDAGGLDLLELTREPIPDIPPQLGYFYEGAAITGVERSGNDLVFSVTIASDLGGVVPRSGTVSVAGHYTGAALDAVNAPGLAYYSAAWALSHPGFYEQNNGYNDSFDTDFAYVDDAAAGGLSGYLYVGSEAAEEGGLYQLGQSNVPTTFHGYGGDDRLIGGSRGDTFFGGAGDDYLSGGDGFDDYYIDPSERDVVVDYSPPYSHDAIILPAGVLIDDLVFGREDSDLLIGAVTVKRFFDADVGYQVETIKEQETPTAWFYRARDLPALAAGKGLYGFGDVAGRALAGTAGNDDLVGTDEADHLSGEGGDDLLDGGGGADRLAGGAGDDVYVVDDPEDRVVESPGEGIDTVVLRHPNQAAAPLADNLENLVITDDARRPMAEWGMFAELFHRGRGIGNDLANRITGSAHDDVIQGRGGDDLLVGSDGRDVMDGGAGADRYRFTAGLAGEAEVRLGAGDAIELVGVSPGQVTLERGGFVYGDVMMGDERTAHWARGSGRGFGIRAGELLVGSQGDFFGAAGEDNSGFSGVDFDSDGDGTPEARWDFAAVEARLVQATAGDDVLYGFDGDDAIHGGPGHDYLGGGDGDDLLYGEAGNDTLVSDRGDDTLNGGPGDDAYLWDEEFALGMLAWGAGHDVIMDEGGADTLSFGPTLDPARIGFQHSGRDLVISTGRPDAGLTVTDWFGDGDHRIERLTTAHGDVLTDTRVELLIQSMNQFMADNPGMDTWHQAVRERPEDTAAILAAHWETA